MSPTAVAPTVVVVPAAAAGSSATTKGQRTRARILTAAAEHFAAVGLDAGSVPEIARHAGISHASIYQHFGRKDELFRATVEADLTSLFQTVVPRLDAGALGPDTIIELVHTLVVASRTHPLARRVLAEIDAEQTEVLRDLPALGELEARLVRALEASQDAGTIRRDLTAQSLAAGIIGVSLPLLVVAFRLDGMPDIPRATGALDLLAAALRPPTPDPMVTTDTTTRSTS